MKNKKSQSLEMTELFMAKAGNMEFTEFLDNTFVCDMLFPVYGEHSVTTIFHGWQGELNYNWCKFTNDDGDILEFYNEGQYVAKTNNESRDVYQLQTPKTIMDFIDDMKRFGIQLHWSEWVLQKFKL